MPRPPAVPLPLKDGQCFRVRLNLRGGAKAYIEADAGLSDMITLSIRQFELAAGFSFSRNDADDVIEQLTAARQAARLSLLAGQVESEGGEP